MSHEHPFAHAARRVQLRLFFASWLRTLLVTALPVFLATAGLLIAVRLMGYRWHDLLAVVGVAVGWVLATAAWSWIRRPDQDHALAEWDQRADRKDAFVSALFFERRGDQATPAERLHVDRARRDLDHELPRVGEHVPAVTSPWTWAMPLVPLLVMVLAATPFFLAAIRPENRPLDDEELARVVALSEEFEKKNADVARLKGMTEEEKAKAEELKAQLTESAAEMKEMKTGKTPYELLSKVEELAAQAESLADAMGESDSLDPSSALVAELERHADTADLGAALRASKTQAAAEESMNIAGRMESSELTLDEKARFKEALDKAMKAAEDADKESLVGKKVGEADEKLKEGEGDFEKAGEKFRELAGGLDRLSQRDQARDRLNEMARDLRSKGQRVFDRQQGGMQQLARGGQPGQQGQQGGMQRMQPGQMNRQNLLQQIQNRGQGQQPGQQGQPGQMGRMGQPGQPGGGQPGGQPGGQIPGGSPFNNNPWAQGQGQGQGGAPIPGQGEGQGMAGGGAPVPGQGAGAGAGRSNVPGQGPPGSGIGVGAAGYRNNDTQRQNPAGTSTVSAAPAGDGGSMVQTIEGQQHREGTSVQSVNTRLDFIQAEEDALAEEKLPVARREQVKNYFDLVRQTMEE